MPLVVILATCEHFTRDKSADVTRGRLDVSSTFFLSFCALLLALGERVFGLKNFGFIHVRHMTFQFHHGFAALLPQILLPLQAPTRDIHYCGAPSIFRGSQ